ncbi:MAG: hypothetical protein HYY13_03425 [Nitrospirae bacterium]|nr:hypothetical protein [Nitrospirota bacterium]
MAPCPPGQGAAATLNCRPPVLLLAARSLALAAALALSCEAAQQPPYTEVLVLEGTPYERGLQHGRILSSKIHSFFTQMMTASLLPYFNRLRAPVAQYILEYQKPLYDNGRFSYELLVQSATNLSASIPPAYLEEIRGVADGAGMPYEEILFFNTFVDTLMGLRSISYFLEFANAPRLTRMSFGALDADGVDNDGDAQTDEAGEGGLDPYEPKPYAVAVEVPPSAGLDIGLVDPDGVDPATIRVKVDDVVFRPGDPGLEIVSDESGGTQLRLRPPGGFREAAAVALLVQAGDRSLATDPPPAHAHFMRDERMVFTTRGYGRRPHEVVNRPVWDERMQAPSIAFAVGGEATPSGQPVVAHHFALLDTNISHKHTVLFVYRPSDGNTYATLGWAGAVWGFSGMNDKGLVFTANFSDTLNNSVAGQFKERLVAARLVADGMPIGAMGREILARAAGVEEGRRLMDGVRSAFGWNVVLADRLGGRMVIELDSNIMGDPDGGIHAFSADAADPGSLDEWGRLIGSVRGGDVRTTANFQKNTNEIDLEILGFKIRSQRFSSTYFYRSVRALDVLGQAIDENYGRLDAERAVAILRMPELLDARDSMKAAVFEPALGRMYFAVGQVPATDGPFRLYDFATGQVSEGIP